jgi:MYXO-CTERM domain-containing protein
VSTSTQRSALHVDEAHLSITGSAWGDAFGNATALGGDTAVIGAPGSETSAGSTGAVDVYVLGPSGWSLQQRIVPASLSRGDRFGHAVSIDGDTLAVSAPGDDTAASNAGAAYVFTRSGSNWSLEQKLTVNDAAADDELGKGPAVSVFGDRLAVGTYEKDNTGAAYLFERSSSTWTQTHRFGHNASTGGFGVAVAGDLDTVIVGASAEEGAKGRAYVYEWNGSTWSETAQLVASDRQGGDYYGVSVAIDADTAVVGATSEDDGGQGAGAAYVYERSAGAWSQAAKLTASNASAADSFGRRVTVDGARLAVTAPKQGYFNFDQGGAAYLFEQTGSGWVEQQIVTSLDRNTVDRFGSGLALSGASLLIGASQHDEVGSDSGAGYLFDHDGTGWSQTDELLPPTGERHNVYSGGIDISGDTVIVGSRHDSKRDYHAGAAHAYEHDGSSWGPNTRIDDGSGGTDHRFGSATAVDADIMAIGQPTAQSYVRGTVFLYERTSNGAWSQSGSINGDDVEADRFGMALDLELRRLAVGAPWDADGGAVYVFDQSLVGSWTQSARLIPADNAQYDGFGSAVDLGSGQLIAGATGHAPSGTETGVAYVFENVSGSWTEAAKLVGSDSAYYDHFGESVAIDGARAAVGAPDHNSAGTPDAGAVYIFEKGANGWLEQAKLTAATPQWGASFGTAVALSGDSLYVGAPDEDTASSGNGAVYVFEYDGTAWTQVERVTPGSPGSHPDFGTALAFDGARLAVMGGDFHNAGGAYVYELSTTTGGGDAGMGDSGMGDSGMGDSGMDSGTTDDTSTDASADVANDTSTDVANDTSTDVADDTSTDGGDAAPMDTGDATMPNDTTVDDAVGGADTPSGDTAGGDAVDTEDTDGSDADDTEDTASGADTGEDISEDASTDADAGENAATDASSDAAADAAPDSTTEASSSSEEGCGCNSTNGPSNGILAGLVLLTMVGLRRARRLLADSGM